MHRLIVLKVGLCLCGILSVAYAQTLNDPKLQVRELTSGLNQPTAMAFIGFGDILVLQKNDGRVRRVINGALQSGEVLDLPVDTASERGLLGIAVHPNFSSTGFVYLYYTQSSTSGDTSGSPLTNRVARYSWNGSTLVNPQLILDLPVTPGPNHDGGTMTFGPDGKLYLVIGDLNRSGQLQNNPAGATPDNTSVIFRINDDGSAPADNPLFALGGNMAKYYAYGVRNSFGLAFDPVSGALWDTENGPSNYDEINLVLPGFNSGWNRIMGPDARNVANASDLVQFPGSHYADPKFSWLTTVGPTALTFVASPRLGATYYSDLLVGDINNARLYRFRLNGARNGFLFANGGLADMVADNNSELQETILGTGFGISFGGISDLKIGPDGYLYVVSYGLGKIFVVAKPIAAADVDGDAKSDLTIYRSGAWITQDVGTGIVKKAVWTGYTSGEIPTPGDYDGDGLADFSTFRNGAWLFFDNTTGVLIRGVWTGGVAGDIPVPGDYDGDGKTDIGIYRKGAWLIYDAFTGALKKAVWTGYQNGEIPVPGDYDGDGTTDLASYRNGGWLIFNNTTGALLRGVWTGGVAGDVPVPGDYDGDGITDVTIYRGGAWIIYDNVTGAMKKAVWTGAAPGEIPTPGDYDGDGITDLSSYRNGGWLFFNNTTGALTGGVWTGGVAGDIPVSAKLPVQ